MAGAAKPVIRARRCGGAFPARVAAAFTDGSRPSWVVIDVEKDRYEVTANPSALGTNEIVLASVSGGPRIQPRDRRRPLVKHSWGPTTAEAFMWMLRMEGARRRGLRPVLEAVARVPTGAVRGCEASDLARFAATARLVMPFRADCLTYSAMLTVLCRLRGIDASLVVGVYAYPFLAHAWCEVDGRPVDDDGELAERLAVVLRI